MLGSCAGGTRRAHADLPRAWQADNEQPWPWLPGLTTHLQISGSARLDSQHQLLVPDLHGDRLADGEVGLFEPMPFEQNIRNRSVWCAARTSSPRTVVMPTSNLEDAILHAFTCCNFYVAQGGGRVGRNSNRYCLGCSLQAGVVFAEPPDH